MKALIYVIFNIYLVKIRCFFPERYVFRFYIEHMNACMFISNKSISSKVHVAFLHRLNDSKLCES